MIIFISNDVHIFEDISNPLPVGEEKLDTHILAQITLERLFGKCLELGGRNSHAQKLKSVKIFEVQELFLT